MANTLDGLRPRTRGWKFRGAKRGDEEATRVAGGNCPGESRSNDRSVS